MYLVDDSSRALSVALIPPAVVGAGDPARHRPRVISSNSARHGSP
jgi:hypothetical protein